MEETPASVTREVSGTAVRHAVPGRSGRRGSGRGRADDSGRRQTGAVPARTAAVRPTGHAGPDPSGGAARARDGTGPVCHDGLGTTRGHMTAGTATRRRGWIARRERRARQRAGRGNAVHGLRAACSVTVTVGRFSGLSAPADATGQEQSGLEPVRAPRTLPGRAAHPSPAASPPCGEVTDSPPADVICVGGHRPAGQLRSTDFTTLRTDGRTTPEGVPEPTACGRRAHVPRNRAEVLTEIVGAGVAGAGLARFTGASDLTDDRLRVYLHKVPGSLPGLRRLVRRVPLLVHPGRLDVRGRPGPAPGENGVRAR